MGRAGRGWLRGAPAAVGLLAIGLVLGLAPGVTAQAPPIPISQPTNEDAVAVVASGGFSDVSDVGSLANSWAASMQWFKGDLYVGTGRASECVTLVSLASMLPPELIDLVGLIGSECPEDPADLPLAAEIWRYRPSTGHWDRVFQSPVDIPVRFDDQQKPTKFTARDISFRAMAVVKEPGGREALYVGGMSAGNVFPVVFDALGNPPPRILRTLDGTHWRAVPQVPGTFLGNLGKGVPGSQVKPVFFDSMVGYHGRLFAAVSDPAGKGAVIASSTPGAGNNAWQLAAPIPELFPVSTLTVFHGFLYCAVAGQEGTPYRVFKADATASLPLSFSLVMSGGSGATPDAAAWRALDLAEYGDRLFVATGTPAEIVRIDADDSWELVVGQARDTDQGFKRPLSGLGLGLGSAFTMQFRRLASHQGQLYVGTSDWSQMLENFPDLGDLAQLEFGFDLFRSGNGLSFSPVTRNGLGAVQQPVVESMASSPAGLFVGGASSAAGAAVWLRTGTARPAVDAPLRMDAVSEEVKDLLDHGVVLSWEPVPGAVAYRVYRATVTPVLDVIGGGGGLDLGSLLDLLAGVCDTVPLICGLAEAVASEAGVPTPFILVGATPKTYFMEDQPATLPSLYFVRAQNAQGKLSPVSNMVGGPSQAAFVSFPSVADRLDAADAAHPARSRMRILKLFKRSLIAAQAGDVKTAERLLSAAEKGLRQGPVKQRVASTEADDMAFFLQGLRRNVWLAEQGLLPIDVVLDGLP